MVYDVCVLTSIFHKDFMGIYETQYCRQTNAQVNKYSTYSIINITVLVTPGIIVQIIKRRLLAFFRNSSIELHDTLVKI